MVSEPVLDDAPTVTFDFIYLCFVGDRALTKFSKIHKDQTLIMKQWSKRLEETAESVNVHYIFFNNHFAGLGPALVNEFRHLMNLAGLDWKKTGMPQRTLFDFSQQRTSSKNGSNSRF